MCGKPVISRSVERRLAAQVDTPVKQTTPSVKQAPEEVKHKGYYQGRDPEKHRAYMKAYMARRRSQGPRIAQDARVDGGR